MKTKTGIGQDSHRIKETKEKPFVLGGVTFDEPFHLEGNSDSDVILHAITNAISGVTGKPVLGPVADALCKKGVTDSAEYLKVALGDLGGVGGTGFRISHVSLTVECARPKILPKLDAIRARVADLLGIGVEDVGLTATTGEGLTDFGKGLGIQAFAVVTATTEII
ncbi:MAG TPA: 2-C-methyl-D-erythritol 2,4-cyclodiphosphate synthase [Fibrobacteria bacterium]|nr:2-C-methyl-D-erythritol 2,4-cyclodiphosphate synthase [Fibrobacteria bacterium]